MGGIDIVAAAITLLVLSPLLVVVAAVVAATSGGPVIFRQERVGQDGVSFEMLKFRTMVEGTHMEVLGDARLRRCYETNDFKLPADDPRITRFGRLLRRSSLDELPQLVNVLRGEMSLVGVRPLLRDELGLRPARDQALYEIHLPGLTGLWQVKGRSRISVGRRVELDRRYLESWSVRSNVRILLRTPGAVLLGPGAH